MIQLKQQLNSILETAFSVGKHMIQVTGPDQQKGHGKRQGRVTCGSALPINPSRLYRQHHRRQSLSYTGSSAAAYHLGGISSGFGFFHLV